MVEFGNQQELFYNKKKKKDGSNLKICPRTQIDVRELKLM